MAKSIRWLPDVDAAKKKAQAEGKYVLPITKTANGRNEPRCIDCFELS
jgi:hypothetical protein